jgi:hypothetical protein
VTFKKGEPRHADAGRTKGTPNRTTKHLKEELLRAADDAHPQGVRGWLVELSDKDPKAFASLLARLLPTEQRVESVGPTVVLRDYTGGKSVENDEGSTPPKRNDKAPVLSSPPSRIN